MTSCQAACQKLPRCNLFTFLKDEQVCKLQNANFDKRVCDMVHGTARPSFQSCLDSNRIPWKNVSGNKNSNVLIYLKIIEFKLQIQIPDQAGQ